MQRPFRLREAYGATGRPGSATIFRNLSPFTFHLSQISLPRSADLDTVRPKLCKDLRDWLLVGMSFIGC